MNTAELKLELINKITLLKETRIIEEIQKILDFELDKGVYQLNEAQINRLKEAEEDYTISEEKANKDIDEWLNEK